VLPELYHAAWFTVQEEPQVRRVRVKIRDANTTGLASVTILSSLNGKVTTCNTGAVVISSGTTQATQSTHDNFNCNANLQVNDERQSQREGGMRMLNALLGCLVHASNHQQAQRHSHRLLPPTLPSILPPIPSPQLPHSPSCRLANGMPAEQPRLAFHLDDSGGASGFVGYLPAQPPTYLYLPFIQLWHGVMSLRHVGGKGEEKSGERATVESGAVKDELAQ